MDDDSVDAKAKWAKEVIDANGYFIQAVLAEGEFQPAYYYTSGLSYARDKRYPELAMAGWLDPDQITSFLRDAVEAMRAGRMVPHQAGYYGGVFANVDVGVVPINPRSGGLLLGLPEDAKAFLVVIPDPDGLFPWEHGCHEHYADQVVGFDITALPPPKAADTVH